MILTCPNCATQYVVKDGAIPPQGRQVRCASCKHSWHQDPEPAAELQLGAEAEATEDAEAEPHEESIAEAALIEPSTGPEAEERAYEEAAIEEAAEEPGALDRDDPDASSDEHWRGLASAAAPNADYDPPPGPELQPDDDFSPFADRESVEPRRRSPLLAIIVLLLVVAALAAGVWFLAPAEWKARLGLAEASTPLTLSNPPLIERRPLASGQDILTVAGRVINPTNKSQPVPPIYAELRDATGKVVYKWTIAPPVPMLAPGATASFNSTEINVPSQSADLTISLVPPKA
jgi:predicted Zn finger-like uncharacterized protein